MKRLFSNVIKPGLVALLIAGINNTIVLSVIQRHVWHHSFVNNSLEFLLSSALVVLFLYPLAKTWQYLFVIHLAVLVSLLSINSLKLSLLGQPVLIADILVLSETFEVLDAKQLLVVIAGGLAAATLLVLGIRLKTVKQWGVVAILLSVFVATYFFPAKVKQALAAGMDFRERNFTHMETYRHVGPVFFLWHNYMSYREVNLATIDRSGAAEIKGQYSASKKGSMASEVDDFNVYIIMGESFVNLDAFDKLKPDPLAPLEKLVGKDIDLRAAVPSFGGGTARSEMELLCGLPQISPVIEFVNMTVGSKKLACLPHVAAKNGYNFYAFHANEPEFFNRFVAYQILGIPVEHHYNESNFFSMDTAWKSDFIPDDAFFTQSLEVIKDKLNSEDSDNNIFYLLTSALHRPYRINPVVYPRQQYDNFVHSKDFERYLSALYHSAGAVRSFAKTIQQIDPDAMFVFMGDHWPPAAEELNELEFSPMERHQTPYFILQANTLRKTRKELNAFDIVDYIYKAKNWENPYAYVSRYANTQLADYRPVGNLLLSSADTINCGSVAAKRLPCRHLSKLKNLVSDAMHW